MTSDVVGAAKRGSGSASRRAPRALLFLRSRSCCFWGQAREVTMAEAIDPKELVTLQELSVSNAY